MIIFSFFMTIFPTIFGLFDFILDIYYVFISAKFHNSDIKYSAYFCFFLSPFISLIAWLLLFTSDQRSQKTPNFLHFQQKYNEKKLQKSPKFYHIFYIILAHLYQFSSNFYNLLKKLPKGLFFTFLQQLKLLILYIYTCSGYTPSYLITDQILKEYEQNQKTLKKNHTLHKKNQKIKKNNKKKQKNNQKQQQKYTQSLKKIQQIQ